MSGGKAARWHDGRTIADVLTQHAVDFIKQNRAKPFFLYFATHDIHVPRVPHPRFRGATRMGPRGDAIAEFDWSAGQVLKTLDELGLADNTLVILSSDNGPVVDDGYKDDAVEKLGSHKPAGPLRGSKSTAFEGGTREPLIVRAGRATRAVRWHDLERARLPNGPTGLRLPPSRTRNFRTMRGRTVSTCYRHYLASGPGRAANCWWRQGTKYCHPARELESYIEAGRSGQNA